MGEYQWKCEKCGALFQKRIELFKHKSITHRPIFEWKCKDCELIFNTRRKLELHRRTEHKDLILKFLNRNLTKICPLCKQHYDGYIRDHLKICPNKKHDRKQTEEAKKKISEGRKKWLREHPNQYPWRRRDKFKSVPCEHLKKNLKKDNYKFIEEYTDDRWEHYYSLDIAFLDKKLAVEVNGTQHYDKNGNLREYYQKRHDYLESQGWTVIEVFYTKCFKDEEIAKIKTAIDTCTNISDDDTKLLIQNMRKSKEERKKERENNRKERLEKARKEGRLRNGKICGSQLPDTIWLERKEKILKSGIDCTKFGWWNKLVIKTGLTKRQIEHTFKHFKEDFKNCKFTSRRIL